MRSPFSTCRSIPAERTRMPDQMRMNRSIQGDVGRAMAMNMVSSEYGTVNTIAIAAK
jgi:hypothetical protein